MEGMGEGISFWNGKNVFLTGCTGFLGSYMAKELVGQAANVTGLVRDGVPRSNLYMGEACQKINMVYGELENEALLERVLGEYEIDTIFHVGAQAIRWPPLRLISGVPGMSWRRPEEALLSGVLWWPPAIRPTGIRSSFPMMRACLLWADTPMMCPKAAPI